MIFKKRSHPPKIFQISDNAIEFIRKYLLPECNTTTKVDADLLDRFLSIAFDWEASMVDENGKDKEYDYPEKERNEMADRFISEVSGKWASGKWVPDFDDLNRKLGF